LPVDVQQRWPLSISDETPTLPELPVLEDDGGASRHQATLDAVPRPNV
jgi:hypothetical protein